MAAYLLATNILLRAVDPASPLCTLVREAVAEVLGRGGSLGTRVVGPISCG
jgi:hypothetical protein